MKQTEIGMIPDDWEVKELQEYFEIGSSKRVFQSQWRKSGIPFYRAREIVILAEQNTVDNELFIDEELYNIFKKQYGVPKINDLLVTGVGTLGKVYKIQNDKPFYYKDGNIICLSNKGHINSDYVKYMYDFPTVINQINDSSGKSTVGTYTISSAKKTKIPLPPTLSEQQKIAKALSDVDNVISTLEKLIAKKKNLKQGTMQQLLIGKKRLPGFAKSDKFKQTEIGDIPEDWEVKELGEVSKNYTGLTYSPKNINEYGTLVLRSSNIQDDMLSFDDNVYVNMNVPERAIAHTGDILICVRNGSKRLIGKSALITESANNCAFGAFMTILRTELLNQQFLFYVWQSDLIQKQIEESMGATINQITNKDIRHYLIAYPKSNTEQTAIANVLSSMDKEIEALNTKLEKYRNLKTGMMQQLLTGKIRLI